MPFNPNPPRRKLLRFKGYDYSQEGLYFITICCQDKICRFGHIENSEMRLNEYGKVAHEEWEKLTERFSNFQLDVFQIMPNHIHGIIALSVLGGNDLYAPTISDIVGAYKSLVANRCLQIHKSLYLPENIPHFGKLWQRNFYEHIIRNEQAYNHISHYIIHNPAKWQEDKFYEINK